MIAVFPSFVETSPNRIACDFPKARPRCRPRVLHLGPVDQAARSPETGVAFACWYLYGVETVIAFAGAGRASTETVVAFAGVKWAFLVQFLGAEVMPVSRLPCWGRAVVLLVSMSLCCRALCAKKFALHAQNTPKLAFLRLLGEFFRGNAAGGGVLGEFFRGNAAGGAVLGELCRVKSCGVV